MGLFAVRQFIPPTLGPGCELRATVVHRLDTVKQGPRCSQRFAIVECYAQPRHASWGVPDRPEVSRSYQRPAWCDTVLTFVVLENVVVKVHRDVAEFAQLRQRRIELLERGVKGWVGSGIRRLRLRHHPQSPQ